jgi:hypothetical protein
VGVLRRGGGDASTIACICSGPGISCPAAGVAEGAEGASWAWTLANAASAAARIAQRAARFIEKGFFMVGSLSWAAFRRLENRVARGLERRGGYRTMFGGSVFVS